LVDAASATRDIIDPDSTTDSTPIAITTMSADEMGAVGYEDTPPGPGGETGLYNVLGGTTTLGLGGSKTVTLSGE
jgi:hypothetical protein